MQIEEVKQFLRCCRLLHALSFRWGAEGYRTLFVTSHTGCPRGFCRGNAASVPHGSMGAATTAQLHLAWNRGLRSRVSFTLDKRKRIFQARSRPTNAPKLTLELLFQLILLPVYSGQRWLPISAVSCIFRCLCQAFACRHSGSLGTALIWVLLWLQHHPKWWCKYDVWCKPLVTEESALRPAVQIFGYLSSTLPQKADRILIISVA